MSVLNKPEISKLLQLREWQNIAQQKATFLAGSAEGNNFFAESKRYGLAADRVEQLEAALRTVAEISSSTRVRRIAKEALAGRV